MFASDFDGLVKSDWILRYHFNTVKKQLAGTMAMKEQFQAILSQSSR